jgi:hypothetical protein
MKALLILIFTIFASNTFAQQSDKDSIILERTKCIIDEIINKADNLDSLIVFLKDSNNTVSNTIIRYFDRYPNYVIEAAQELSEHILKNDFKNGYIIETKELGDRFHNNKGFQSFELKIRSKKTKDIIIFLFYNSENNIWKLGEYDFCSNYMEQIPEYRVPCKKD